MKIGKPKYMGFENNNHKLQSCSSIYSYNERVNTVPSYRNMDIRAVTMLETICSFYIY